MMKLLLFSDLHASRQAALSIVQRAKDFDMLVSAGDFANERRDLHICVDILQPVEKPVVLVAGNNETTDELKEACKNWPAARVLHGNSIQIGELVFFGMPGAVPVTPFGAWSFDFTEEQAAEMLAGCPPGCVLISHSPPKGAVDRSSRGESFGSVAVRDAILRVKPRLVVCGHIHACSGQTAQIGNTPVVNAGPHGVEWQLS